MQTSSYLIDSLEQLTSCITSEDESLFPEVLVQIFSTQPTSYVQQYHDFLKQHFSKVVIIGQSSLNVIYQNQRESNGTLILVSKFSETTLTATMQPFTHQPEKDGSTLISNLNVNTETKAILSFLTLTDEGDYPIFDSFNPHHGFPAVSGGLAQANRHGCWVFLNGQFHSQACVAVSLNSKNLQVWRECFSEWDPIGRAFRVTEAVGNTILSLDYLPIYDVYKDYLADGRTLAFNHLISFPLYLVNDDSTSRVLHPLSVNSDGSIEFDGELEIGAAVKFCYNHPSLTVDKVRQDVETLIIDPPESVFIYNCSSRLDFIDGAEELRPFNDLFNVDGVYCMGELFQSESQQEILHHSMTYLGLKEDNERSRYPLDSERKNRCINNSHATLSPLFTLIRKSISDLNQQNTMMENKLDTQAARIVKSYRYDSITGLLSRQALNERLSNIKRDECVLTLKLLNFRQINEKYGYTVGDELLRDISKLFIERLKAGFNIAAETKLFSIGIGEWALLFVKGASTSSNVVMRFNEFADEIEHLNLEPNGLPDVDHLSVSLCGGFASAGDFEGIKGSELLFKAIEARRTAAEDNRHICNAKDLLSQESQRKAQLGWLSCVSRAVLNHNIVTFSQPIFEAHSHRQISQECLVRIIENDGIISPGLFLPIVEGTHLYNRLSRYMVRSTIEYMANRKESFSINLSPQDLMSERTLAILESSIQKMNDPSRLGLEVLESEQIKDYGRMIEVCNHFKRLGTKIVVDDFGAGYSNMDEIIKLQPDVIKLDGSLIKTLDRDKKQRKITEQLIRLCQVFEAKTVAEFIHNEEVCKIAEGMGIDYLQGFYLGEPTRLF